MRAALFHAMNQNYFELFGLAAQFDIDADALDRAYRELQSRVHPDKFAQGSDAERRVAMQWATFANEAYTALKSPLKRARYLCELAGVDMGIETNTAMPAQFLMQQMEWREALGAARAARDSAKLDALEAEIRSSRAQELAALARLLGAGQHAEAARHVRQLMFIEKFGSEVGDAFEALQA